MALVTAPNVKLPYFSSFRMRMTAKFGFMLDACGLPEHGASAGMKP
jgi:hypothetical protein